MVKIDCSGLSLNEGKELAEYLKAQDQVVDARLELDLRGMHTRSIQMSIPHFHLLVHGAEGAGAALGITAGGSAAAEFGKDVYKAVKGWMERRFSDKSAVPVEVNLYGPDGMLIDKIAKRR